MPRKRKRDAPSPTPPVATPASIAEEANRVVAAFSSALLFTEPADELKQRLVPLTPDPTPEILAQHPRLRAIGALANDLVFHETGLSADEEKLVAQVITKAGFSPFNVLMEVLSRIPNVQEQLRELEQHGVPQPALVAALVMAPEELQGKVAAALPGIKKHLGQRRGQLKSFITSGRTLKLPPAALEPAEASVEAKTQALERIDAVLGKYQRATRALTRQTKTSLVSDVRLRVVLVLLKHGFSKTKAFARTADLLRAWHPQRFVGLTASHVRLSFQRVSRRRAG